MGGDGGGMNCGYIASKPGIFKAITVVAGLFAQGWIAYGVNKSDYYADSKHVESCRSREKSDQTVKDAGKLLGFGEDGICPEPWLGVTAFSIAIICFLSSLIMLLVLLCVKLNQSGMFNQLDFIGHLVAGVCLIFGGIFAIAYATLVYNKYNCGKEATRITVFNESEEKCNERIGKFYQQLNFAIGGGISILTAIAYIITAVIIKQQKPQ